MLLSIAPWYFLFHGILFVVFSLKVISVRREKRVSQGDAGDQSLIMARGIHENYSNAFPFLFIPLVLLELNQSNILIVHAFGLVSLVLRIMHWYGIRFRKPPNIFRTISIAGTFLYIFAISILLIISTF